MLDIKEHHRASSRNTMELMKLLLAFFTLANIQTLFASAHGWQKEPIKQPPMHLLRQLSLSGGGGGGVSCESWRLGVETHNLRGWKMVPRACERYISRYMLGDRYRQDSSVVVLEAEQYARGLKLGGDGKEVWIFDVDETALSNLPYYDQRGFGAQPVNASALLVWSAKGTRPALPESLRLYKRLLSLGIKVVFLSSETEDTRDLVEANIKNAGYLTWEKLLLREKGVRASTAAFKAGERKKLVQEGYKIVGNIGDQWSDILGAPEGVRTFKLPNPMYYIS